MFEQEQAPIIIQILKSIQQDIGTIKEKLYGEPKETAMMRVIKGFKKVEEEIQQVKRDKEGKIIQNTLPRLQKTKDQYRKKFAISFDPNLTEQVETETLSEPEEEKIWRSREEKLMAAVIAIFSLMRRHDWLRLLGEESPEYYIKEIYCNLIEMRSDNEQTELEKIFASKEANELWKLLANAHQKEVRLFFWDKLNIAERNQSHTDNFIRFREILDEFINDEKSQDYRHLHFLSEPLEGGYDAYCKELYSLLRKPVDLPELVLLDTIDLANYHDRGLIVPISLYNKDIHSGEEIDNLCKLPGSDNLLAIPIIPNWQEAAICNQFFSNDQFSAGRNYEHVRQLFNDLKKDRDKHLDLISLTEINLQEIQETWDKVKDESVFRIDKFRQSKIPIIPMQAASGAHIVYTFFAYMSNIDDNSQPFIKVEWLQDFKFKLIIPVKEGNLIERVKYFLTTAFCFAPIDVLCLDHLRSALLRDVYPYWFDPCLPREAVFFQKNNWPEYLGVAKINNKNLTCLGGYCLAMLSCTSDRRAVAGMTTGLRRKVYTKLYNLDDDKKDPNKIISELSSAIRPFFPFWRSLEETISNVVRIHLFTLLMARTTWKSDHKEEDWAPAGVKDFVDKRKQAIKNIVNAH